jgi:phosphatidylglycerol lysyltransferase
VHNRDAVLSLVERHGWNATAFQALETGYEYFFHGADACVAYVDTGSAWVAAGAPIAAGDALESIARAFCTEAAAHGRRASFFATEARFQQAVRGLSALQIGEQPVCDPTRWPAILEEHRSLREQLRRARAKRVRVREVSAPELERGPTRDAMRRVCADWLGSRPLSPMGFLVRVEPFAFAAQRRCFVAEHDGRLVGFAGVIPVPARNGWFLEDLLRAREAPNGTNELLIDAVMRWAASSGCTWLTLGLAPLAGDVPAALRVMRRATAALYDFDGLYRFKAKFRPASWAPIYLAYPEAQGAIVSVVDALSAFAGGDLFGFGVRSLQHRTRAVLSPSFALSR